MESKDRTQINNVLTIIETMSSTYQSSRHKCIKKLYGEDSESHKHNPMSLQLYVWCNRRQVTMMMRVNRFADGIQNFMKTLNLNTP